VSETQMTETGFMGKITAATTHDMKNVLAIIKESAGLMEDLLALQKDLPAQLQERLSRVANNINQQVQRGVDLATRLNAFAHGPDQTIAEVDLNLVADQVICLSQRFARLKNVSLKALTQNRPVILVTDPLKIQMLIFECIDLLLSAVETKTTISLQPVQRTDGSVMLEFSSEETKQEENRQITDLGTSPRWAVLKEVAQSLNGAIQTDTAPDRLTLTFESGSR
jgi:signal transduction histidine kinase